MMTDTKNSLSGRAIAAFAAGCGITAMVLMLGFGALSGPAVSAGFAVGYINAEHAIRSHPQFDSVQQQVGSYAESRAAELAGYKGRELNDDEKREFIVKSESINLDIALKEEELMAPLAVELETAINSVGQQSGVEVVLESAAVLFGGVDLTPAVIQELKAP